jgi:hypothetical protein
MDDFNIPSLQESKNEWSARLIGIFTPFVTEGIKSMFSEAKQLCEKNSEEEKYLMTFQNFLARTPKWNPSIIEEERNRIIEKSKCSYLEELITCVHIIQLKLLTAVRVGHKQKKINIAIPKLDDFIHKVYINVSRKIYSNVYLFEINLQSLQVQKYNRELEMIVQECILNTIRESIPLEAILRAYLDETIEEDVEEQIVEEVIKPVKKHSTTQRRRKPEVLVNDMPSIETPIEMPSIDDPIEKNDMMIQKFTQSGGFDKTAISFNNVDAIRDENNNDHAKVVSKDYENLKRIQDLQRANDLQKSQSLDDDERINILDDVTEPFAVEDLSMDNLLGIEVL